MPDQPTDKIILKLDDDKLKELFGRMQPGDSISLKCEASLDQVDDDIATLSIDPDEPVDVTPIDDVAEDAAEAQGDEDASGAAMAVIGPSSSDAQAAEKAS
jgi:hypothetical protein